MLIHQYGWPFRTAFPQYTWKRPSEGKDVYLTFDDGPIPEVTEYVLDELQNRSILATFFCVGDNVRKHPDIFQSVIAHGHTVANHTHNHLNGKYQETDPYLDNVLECEGFLTQKREKKLFRPPYGRLTKSQAARLLSEYEVIMWDVLSGDFHPDITAEMCLAKSIRYTRPGSIVLFHDSVKTYEKLQYALPRYLDHCLEQGYSFKCL